MNKEAFKESMKEIEYVSGKDPEFNMPSYSIKYGKIRMRTGD